MRGGGWGVCVLVFVASRQKTRASFDDFHWRALFGRLVGQRICLLVWFVVCMYACIGLLCMSVK